MTNKFNLFAVHDRTALSRVKVKEIVDIIFLVLVIYSILVTNQEKKNRYNSKRKQTRKLITVRQWGKFNYNK